VTSPGARPRPRIEPWSRERHGDGAARVVEAVYREWGFTWEPEGYHDDVVRPEAHYIGEGAFFDVAVDGDLVVGTIGGVLEGDEAELVRLYVLPSHRRLGLGRALSERFLSWARSAGATRTFLWSDKRFVAAHALYESLGLRVFSERICPGDPDRSIEWGYTRTESGTKSSLPPVPPRR
jgi:GNAT superfamily N-acetyltransferase